MLQYDTQRSSAGGSQTHERVSGYPNPKLYDQFYINKYSFPKGLQAIYKSEEERNKRHAFKQSLYDIKIPNPRRGINGWKLTRRPHDYVLNQGRGNDASPDTPTGQKSRRRAQTN